MENPPSAEKPKLVEMVVLCQGKTSQPPFGHAIKKEIWITYPNQTPPKLINESKWEEITPGTAKQLPGKTSTGICPKCR